MFEPRTEEEWAEAADLALFFWRIHRGGHWGLIQGGPVIDEERCREILLRAETRGITPEAKDLERALFGG
jgi:hypothetical protein